MGRPRPQDEARRQAEEQLNSLVLECLCDQGGLPQPDGPQLDVEACRAALVHLDSRGSGALDADDIGALAGRLWGALDPAGPRVSEEVKEALARDMLRHAGGGGGGGGAVQFDQCLPWLRAANGRLHRLRASGRWSPDPGCRLQASADALFTQ